MTPEVARSQLTAHSSQPKPMKQHLFRLQSEFEVGLGNEHAQAAEMVLPAGESTGGPDNVHEDSDQWLYVVSGEGEAIVKGTAVTLSPGTMLLIEKGEPHEIRNTGDVPLKTVNIYIPPEY
jgi:mannose-6-phosphate isomerase-like protein (cupin superfamily)